MCAKILIVDDQAVMLKLLSIPLQAEGHTVVTATTGADALAKVRAERPDLVILDIMLPDMSGIEVCQQIREQLHLLDLPIMMLSGRTEVQDKIRGLEAGADEYITKPVDPEEMVVRVRTLLGRLQRLRSTAAAPSHRGRVISVIGVKGGVGTTTVAINLGLALAMRNQPTIAVELRPYFGTFATQLGLPPSVNLGELLELTPRLINEERLRPYLLSTGHPHLRAILGPQRLQDYRDIEAEQVESLLASLVNLASNVVLDLPHLPSVASRAAVRLSQTILMVVELEPGSLAAAKALQELFRIWGVGQALVKLVAVNRSQGAHSLSLGEMSQQLGYDALGLVTAAPDLALQALAAGRPILELAPDALVTHTFFEMADRLTARPASRPIA
ncbi:MAG: hypothetical protein KatS3mg050_0354 [Litorilinea sp.]|nr:MAG: hypothetical protein KatS3mg050_0354 [Litorilinea sp.]